MIIASQKKKENIAEYLLYMWQIEDIIRAYGLDIDQIQKHIINSYDLPEEQKKSMREWYESLIDMMHSEGVENLKSATPFPKCYLHKEKWTFDS